MNYKREELIEDGEEDSLPDLWNPTQKLDMALKMAEALSLLHSHPGGVIVHGDVQFVQYLLDEDGESVILSDFNRAEPLLFDESTGEYCKYVVGRGGGNVRAPEEYSEELLDEKIDVYSFGPVLYSILTGNEPFVDDHHIEEHEVWPFVIKGLLPMVPSEIRGHSFAEAAMVAIMYKCFEYFRKLSWFCL
jgi:serine/threonine protein kinase